MAQFVRFPSGETLNIDHVTAIYIHERQTLALRFSVRATVGSDDHMLSDRFSTKDEAENERKRIEEELDTSIILSKEESE